jgi:hypothetical protein
MERLISVPQVLSSFQLMFSGETFCSSIQCNLIVVVCSCCRWIRICRALACDCFLCLFADGCGHHLHLKAGIGTAISWWRDLANATDPFLFNPLNTGDGFGARLDKWFNFAESKKTFYLLFTFWVAPRPNRSSREYGQRKLLILPVLVQPVLLLCWNLWFDWGIWQPILCYNYN